MEIQTVPEREIAPSGNRFEALLRMLGLDLLERQATTVLQINVGKLCNQACQHCHVEAGPKRTEIMTAPVVRRLIAVAAYSEVGTVDLTGGAPEMNPHFRELVEAFAALGKKVIVRCNLTIVEEPGFDWLPAFYAQHRVHLVCSLPCYTPENVNKQRGKGVFDRSIAAMGKLNAVGYAMQAGAPAERGAEQGALQLDLVYNPLGPLLPPDQSGLEADYRRELMAHFGVRFSRLLTLANLPIGRFARDLKKGGRYDPYLKLLEQNFNPQTLPHLMCRNTLSVGWDGRIYDCDFNQMLGMTLGGAPGEEASSHGGASVLDADFSLEALTNAPIRTGRHCLGCTAGAGSSCGGALT